jgi:dTDP-glucose 4,6-dehydratase
MGKPADFIEFVADRPGHDLRYAIDGSSTTSELGWKPLVGSLEAGLPSVIQHYVSLAQSGKFDVSKISGSGLSVSI